MHEQASRIFNHMISFANASDTKLMNRPKMTVSITFYINQRVREKILHSARLHHTTSKHLKLHWSRTTPSSTKYSHFFRVTVYQNAVVYVII